MENVKSVKKGRTILNMETENMQKELIEIVQSISMSMLKMQKYLMDNDLEVAYGIVEHDEVINKKCLDLERYAYRIISLQQPITKDLRKIVSIIRIIPDLERIGDHVKVVARDMPKYTVPGIDGAVELLCIAFTKLREKLEESIEYFINEDVEMATKLAEEDDEIDAISSQILKIAVKEMKDDSNYIKYISKLILSGKSIERIGDYIVNICESTIFLKTGELVELS